MKTRKFKHFRAEFHVHTVLSPCASVEMIPPLIIRSAEEKGINLLAITDHNSTANIQAVIKAAENTNILILPGVELQTREDVHVLCIFDTLEKALELQNLIDRSLPQVENQPDIFGPQYIVDSTGEFVSVEERLLIQATTMSIDQAWKSVHQLGGLFIPSHISRSSFGILPMLGFIPSDIPFDALEITLYDHESEINTKYPSTQGFPLIRSGDAHFLDDIRGALELILMDLTVEEIRQALHHINQRKYKLKDLR